MLWNNYILGLASIASIGGVASAAVRGHRGGPGARVRSGDGAGSGGCSSYLIVNARGSLEPMGEEADFISMNQQIMSAVPGGKLYSVNYPASADQNTASGTADVLRIVAETLKSDPSACFILEGHSQGATVVTNALSGLSGAAFDAVKFVFLTGNPEHNPGLPCNIDENGGSGTRGTTGQIANEGSVPSNWYSKTRDVCYTGDGVCDKTAAPRPGFPGAITPPHGKYASCSSVQSIGPRAAIQALRG